eukprot:6062337-Prymnesium_polylepis.1
MVTLRTSPYLEHSSPISPDSSPSTCGEARRRREGIEPRSSAGRKGPGSRRARAVSVPTLARGTHPLWPLDAGHTPRPLFDCGRVSAAACAARGTHLARPHHVFEEEHAARPTAE